MNSQVGFCFQPDIEVPAFEVLFPGQIDTVLRDERGTLFLINSIHWDETRPGSLAEAVHEFLWALLDDGLGKSFLLIEVVDDKSQNGRSTNDWLGQWDPNSFGMDVDGRIVFREQESSTPDGGRDIARDGDIVNLLWECRTVLRDIHYGYPMKELDVQPETLIQRISDYLGENYDMKTNEVIE